MIELAKTLGLGLATAILSPFILVAFVIYLAYTIIIYLVHEITSIVLFFFGKNFKLDDEETCNLLLAKEEYAKRKERKSQPVYTYVVPPNQTSLKQESNEKEGESND